MFSPEPKGTKASEAGEVGPDTLSCACLCKCFGYFRYDEWPNMDTDDAKNII